MEDMESVAVDACRTAGEYLASRFRESALEAEFDTTDVKAAVDREAEKRVLREIRGEFPDHRVVAEEDGESGTDGSYTWVVDPLDGTNNFVSGVSVFATAVAVLDADGPLLSVIYEPLPDALYVARRDGGATVNGVRLDARNDVPLEHGTVSLVVGLDAIRDEELAARAEAIQRAIGEECKRVLETWAPCVDWGLVARGSLEGVVSFHPDVYEQHAGYLLAEESEATTYESGELSIASQNGETVDRLRSAILDR